MADSMEDWPPPAAITTFADGDPAENGWVSDAPPVEAIEIAAYSPEWPVLFEASKELIAQALPGVALNIEHVGSTAVPNLAAKPIIDMDLIIDDPTREETYVPALAALGYVLTIRERTWYEHRMLRHDQPRINLHVFGRNCPEHARHILFRDWLRTHPGGLRPIYACEGRGQDRRHQSPGLQPKQGGRSPGHLRHDIRQPRLGAV
jgi:GrpB-like predicted nucleotidyltransferase (UPF0157 family)